MQFEFPVLNMMHLDKVHDIVKKLFDSFGDFVSRPIFFVTNVKVDKLILHEKESLRGSS